MEHSKLIIAVVSGDDNAEVISELNAHGFYVTVLSTSGGFLKKKSVTLMIGTSEDKVDCAKSILKEKAGRRRESVYYHAATFSEHDSGQIVSAPAPIPIEQEVGGVTMFIMDLDQLEKF
jgi:uncharacterized protein YaaQ